MKKQIALAVLLGVSSPLFANFGMPPNDEQATQEEGLESQKEAAGDAQENTFQQNAEQPNEESSEQIDAQPQVIPLCALFGFSFWDQTSEAFQLMQDRANNVLVSMHLKKKCNGILNDLKELLVIEAQQEDDEKSEQSENGKDERDEEIEQLRKALRKNLKSSNKLAVKQVNRINELLAELTKKQTTDDEQYARWLSDQPDEEL